MLIFRETLQQKELLLAYW